MNKLFTDMGGVFKFQAQGFGRLECHFWICSVSWIHEISSYKNRSDLSTVKKNCSSDREKLLKFKAEVREFSKKI